MQRSGEMFALLGNGDQQVGTQRGPNLHPYAVGRVAQETAQAEVLLDPTEEKFDTPATAVNLGDGEGIEREPVGQEHERLPAFRIDIADPPQWIGILLPSLARVELDRLVAAQSHGFVDRSGLGDIVKDAGLQPRDEERSGGMQAVQTLEVQVTSVEHISTAWVHRNLVQRSRFVAIPLVETGKYGNVVPQVQQDVQLHRRLLLLPPRPWTQCQAELDHGRIQGEQVRFQAQLERRVRVEPTRTAHEDRSDLREDTPVPLFVRVRQVRPRDPAADPHVIGPRRPRLQAGLDVAQSLPIGQLGKNHRGEVIVDRKRTRGPRHRELRRRPRKLHSIQAGENLRENGRGRIHFRARMTRKPSFQTMSVTPL